MDKNNLIDDEIFMEEAIKLALIAAERDEVPVGAVAVRDGKIIESGTHDELLARGGIYHKLYMSQFDE